MGFGKPRLPLVYSCSGCSSAAQMANYVALCLDRAREAEMSCIAGVGGDVPSLVKLATSGRPVIAIDGCPLRCVRNCLARHGVEPRMDVVLTDHGVKKRFHAEFDENEAVAVYRKVVQALGNLGAGGTVQAGGPTGRPYPG
jgi:uncharacterized metal-binding protein